MANEIQFEQVSKIYPTQARQRSILKDFFSREKTPIHFVIKGMDLTISEGEKILFLGTNGAGKTTLLKLAGGFIRPDEGSVTLNSKPVALAPREQFGLMLSVHLLYRGISGYQNLEHSAYLYRCENVKKTVANSIEYWGLQSFSDDIVETYSNGMKVMLAMARATLHKPRFLLLDEPTAFLDDQNAERLRTFIRDYKGTLVITAQDAGFYENVVDRVIYL